MARLINTLPQVFGSAELCFNAVSFLVSIPGKVSKIYDTLGDLFDRIFAFLSQFKIYERIEQYSNIDPALFSTISEFMISFVNICGLAIQLLHASKFEKLKVILLVAFTDDDSGVGAELANLEFLIQKRGGITDALTLEAVLKNQVKLTELDKALGITGQMLDNLTNGVEGVRDDVGLLIDMVERIDTFHANEISTDIVRWLQPPNYRSSHDYTSAKRRPTTGLWFINGSAFEKWKNSPNSVISLHGSGELSVLYE